MLERVLWDLNSVNHGHILKKMKTRYITLQSHNSPKIFVAFVQILLNVNLSLNQTLLTFLFYLRQTWMTLLFWQFHSQGLSSWKDSATHMHGLAVSVKEGLYKTLPNFTYIFNIFYFTQQGLFQAISAAR